MQYMTSEQAASEHASSESQTRQTGHSTHACVLPDWWFALALANRCVLHQRLSTVSLTVTATRCRICNARVNYAMPSHYRLLEYATNNVYWPTLYLASLAPMTSFTLSSFSSLEALYAT